MALDAQPFVSDWSKGIRSNFYSKCVLGLIVIKMTKCTDIVSRGTQHQHKKILISGTPPPLLYKQKSQINTVPTPTVAWTRR